MNTSVDNEHKQALLDFRTERATALALEFSRIASQLSENGPGCSVGEAAYAASLFTCSAVSAGFRNLPDEMQAFFKRTNELAAVVKSVRSRLPRSYVDMLVELWVNLESLGPDILGMEVIDSEVPE